MTWSRILKWIAGISFALLLLPVLGIALVGWNWLRAPIERMALEKTGRALSIGGDFTVDFAWPQSRLRAAAVTFANPAWAQEKHMLATEAVEVVVDLPQLLGRNIVFPEVRLQRPVIFLEQASGGRKNWLLDLEQQDEEARITIGRLMLDQGQLGYDDAREKTSIRAELSTPQGAAASSGLNFTAHGKYRGQSLLAHGNGGPVLALRDESAPYPLQLELSMGSTTVKAAGTVTSLSNFRPWISVWRCAVPAWTSYFHCSAWSFQKLAPTPRKGTWCTAGATGATKNSPAVSVTAILAER